jgi:outer membrane protein OmpA-like peptidoglycan-associated protein
VRQSVSNRRLIAHNAHISWQGPAAIQGDIIMKPILFGTLAVFALSACQSIGDKTLIGAGAGAVVGAGVGVLAGGNDTRNAAIGAAVGAIAGGAIGAYMDKQERELRESTQNTGIEVERIGDQIALTMPSGLTFDVNSSAVKSGFQTPLNDVAASLANNPKTAVDIIGHASSDGDDYSNQVLSEQRANSVKSYLTSHGLQTVRVNSYGMGETQPVADNATQAGREANRRVEILLTPIVEDGA